MSERLREVEEAVVRDLFDFHRWGEFVLDEALGVRWTWNPYELGLSTPQQRLGKVSEWDGLVREVCHGLHLSNWSEVGLSGPEGARLLQESFMKHWRGEEDRHSGITWSLAVSEQ